ncbi:MAG: ADP-ribosylglycohydrolase family protein [Planctomycetes bacterium]|nr:ADP-ribosylglycohydrolase family protein [Planctomycetota bacterium]
MQIAYDVYLDKVLGGWIGKSMGGAIGARFEGNKGWIEISPDGMFPEKMPPNDDLDLQVLWLKVLEEKGAALTSDDLADAWLEGCWYPFNEYGIFRRNYRLGIHPPYTGSFTNQFWETGMGCPIRAEIWGYAFPGAPDLAAAFAEKDGTLDHTEQSVGAEKMLAAMASMAFFVPDVRRLAAMFMHYLPEGTEIEKLTKEAFRAHEQGLTLREARDRLMVLAGNPEACDSRTNVPFTFLGLLYGGNDLTETMLAALRCGYDTDCTLATAGALLGQIIGAAGIPQTLKEQVGDELVMGIEYRRGEMTLTALARDTARIGVLLSLEMGTGTTITDAPEMKPFPAAATAPSTSITVDYHGLPAAAPGETVEVSVGIDGVVAGEQAVDITGPDGWTVVPQSLRLSAVDRSRPVRITAPPAPSAWPMKNIFTAALGAGGETTRSFGIAGAGLWRLLGIHYDALPDENDPVQRGRRMQHHFVTFDKEYIPEPDPDIETLFRDWSVRLGRPAVLFSHQHEVAPERIIGMDGPYCAYFSRTVICPDDREAFIQTGNTDAFKLWLNGEKIAEMDEHTYWSPNNNTFRVNLRKGENLLLLKLLNRGSGIRFTLGFRECRGAHGGWPGTEDWMVDLADKPI